MKIFSKSFLFILALMLTLLTSGTLERVLYIFTGMLFYTIIRVIIDTEFKYFKRITCGLLVGYLAASVTILSNKYEIKYSEFKSYSIDEDKTAVILLFDIDSSKYNPPSLIKNFQEFNSLFNLYKLPFNLYRNKILAENFNDNINIYYSKLICENLQESLGEEYIVYRSYTNQSPYIEESIQKSIKAGNTEIVVTPISLVGTKMVEFHHDIIQGTRFQVENVEFKSTNYLWNSELMVESYVERINSNIQVKDRSRVGVVLVGEILEKGTENEIFIKQDILFREKISSLLKKHGYDNNKIRLTFLNKRFIKEEIEGLMEYGVGQIIIVHISNESQKNSSLEMIQNLVKSLEVPQDIKITQIYGWTPDEYIIKELLKRIELVKYKRN